MSRATELSFAVDYFEASFGDVETIPTGHSPDLPWQFSAGECSQEDVPPALFVTPEHAIDSWLDFVRPRAARLRVLVWYHKPELMKFQMTMADSLQRQRIVSDRYCVKSQFVVK